MNTEASNKYKEVFHAKCAFSTLTGFVAGYFLFPIIWGNSDWLINLLLGFLVSTIYCLLNYFLHFRPAGKGRLFENRSKWLSDLLYIPIGIGALGLAIGIYFLLFRLPSDWAIAAVVTFPGVSFVIFTFGLLCSWTAAYSLSAIPVLTASAIEFMSKYKRNNTG